jgi:hypothetical protein
MRRPGPLRIAYWIIMLIGIGVLLWIVRGMLAPYNDLMKR